MRTRVREKKDRLKCKDYFSGGQLLELSFMCKFYQKEI